jgi:hypothetical protein
MQIQRLTAEQAIRLLVCCNWLMKLQLLFLRRDILLNTVTTDNGTFGFGGLAVSVLASGTQVRGFKPGRSRRIFKGGKILSTPSFGREVKCRRFAACKRTLNVPWKSAFRQNYRSLFPPMSSNFRRWSAERVGRRGGIWWPKLECPKRAVQ